MPNVEPKTQEPLPLGWQAKSLGTAQNEEVDWKTIHAAVQQVFSGMAKQLAGRYETKCSYTETDRFLFSYLLVQNPGDETIDPVVVGITFSKDQAQVEIEGDIGGEQTGDFLVDPIKDKVAASTDGVKAAALRIASKLVEHTGVVPQALRNKSRVVP